MHYRKILIGMSTLFILTGCRSDTPLTPDQHHALKPPKSPKKDDIVPVAGLYDGQNRGVYYFAGWQSYPVGLYEGTEIPHAFDPWGLIRDAHSGVRETDSTAYFYTPDRKPGLGFIDEDNQSTADSHILSMLDAGFDFVAYQVGWSHDKWRGYGPAADPIYFDYAARNHKTSQYASQVKMALTWHEVYGTDAKIISYWSDPARAWTPALYVADLRAMVNAWFTRYIDNNPNWFRVNGKPVVFVFAAENLDRVATHFGLNGATMVGHIRSVAAEHGDGIYLVATSVAPTAVQYLDDWGFDAYSGYQYGGGYNYDAVANYTEAQWTNSVNGPIAYWPSAITGGDGTPWGLNNLGASNLARWEQHLTRLASFVGSHQTQTGVTSMVCCWNEWGEGEYMQPSDFTTNLVHRGSALADSHRNVTLGMPGANYPPFGWFDAIDPSGLAWGWALDQDTPNSPIHLHFYVDNSYDNGGTWIGGAVTTIYRGDINSAYGILGTHGFAWQVPDQYRGRKIYVHMINSSGNQINPLMGGSYRIWN